MNFSFLFMYFLDCFDFVYSDDFLAPIERICHFLAALQVHFRANPAVFIRYSSVSNGRGPFNSFHRMIRAISTRIPIAFRRTND
jgi:hypothetical protein